MPSASSYGSPTTSGTAVPRPLTRNAVTFRRCQGSRSSRRTTAIFVSKRTGSGAGSGAGAVCGAFMLRDCRAARPGVLYVLCVAAAPPQQRDVSAWRPRVPGVLEVFHAHFVEYAYPMHVHDSWTLLIVDDGAVRYDLDRHERGTPHDTVTLLPPHVPHNGSPATPDGFRKRVLYLDSTHLGDELIGAAVDRPDLRDPLLRLRVGQLHGALVRAGEEFEAASRLALVARAAAYAVAGGGRTPSRACRSAARPAVARAARRAARRRDRARRGGAARARPSGTSRTGVQRGLRDAAAPVSDGTSCRPGPAAAPRRAVRRRGRDGGRVLRPGPSHAPLQEVGGRAARAVPARP